MKKALLFLKNKTFWIWLVFTLIVVGLYIKGTLIEKEIGVRPNYFLAFAEILSVTFWGLSYSLTRDFIANRFNRLYSFLSKRHSIIYLVGFLFCIVIAAILSFTKLSFFVKQFANIAFFMLVWAVIIDLVDLVKNKQGS